MPKNQVNLLILRQKRSNKNEYHSLLWSKQGKQKRIRK